MRSWIGLLNNGLVAVTPQWCPRDFWQSLEGMTKQTSIQLYCHKLSVVTNVHLFWRIFFIWINVDYHNYISLQSLDEMGKMQTSIQCPTVYSIFNRYFLYEFTCSFYYTLYVLYLIWTFSMFKQIMNLKLLSCF